MHRHLFLVLIFLSQFASAVTPPKPAVPAPALGASLQDAPAWKGKPYDTHFQFSALSGIGLMGTSTGVPLYGAVAFKVLHEGFIDDINDQLFVEAMGGPLFTWAGAGWVADLHLRWDFHKNDLWSFYVLGGVGVDVSGTGLARVTLVHPRVGVGAFWNLFEFLSFRAEVSHEFTGIGVVYLL